jgi:hypothetical protein
MTEQEKREGSDETSEESSEQREERPRPEMYYVHNVTRGRHNRTQRAGQPKHHGLKQYIGGGKYRSIRGRPIALTREQVMQHIEELVKKVDAGIFELRTQDGRIVDIRTGEAAPRGASAALPRPVLDSIANDQQNVGEQMPQFPGGDVVGTPGTEPSLIADAEEEEPAAVVPPAPPPAPVTSPSEPVTEVSPEIAPPAPVTKSEPEASVTEPTSDAGVPPVEETATESSDETPDLVGGDEEEVEEKTEASTSETSKKPSRSERKKAR